MERQQTPVHDPDKASGVTRERALTTAALAAGGALVTVTAIGAADRSNAAPSAERDKRVLNLLLRVEYTEAAFYAAALKDAGLTGELEDYARVVLAHEQEHVGFLKGALGTRPTPSRTTTSRRSRQTRTRSPMRRPSSRTSPSALTTARPRM